MEEVLGFKNNQENLEKKFLNKIKSAKKEDLPDLMNEVIKKPELKYSKNENFLNSLLSLYENKIANFDWDWVSFYKQFYFLNKKDEIKDITSTTFFKLLNDISEIKGKIISNPENRQKEIEDFESLILNFNFLKSKNFFDKNREVFENIFNNLIKNNHLEEAGHFIGNYSLKDNKMLEFIKSENVLPEIRKVFVRLIKEGNFYWAVKIKYFIDEESLFNGLNLKELEKSYQKSVIQKIENFELSIDYKNLLPNQDHFWNSDEIQAKLRDMIFKIIDIFEKIDKEKLEYFRDWSEWKSVYLLDESFLENDDFLSQVEELVYRLYDTGDYRSVKFFKENFLQKDEGFVNSLNSAIKKKIEGVLELENEKIGENEMKKLEDLSELYSDNDFWYSDKIKRRMESLFLYVIDNLKEEIVKVLDSRYSFEKSLYESKEAIEIAKRIYKKNISEFLDNEDINSFYVMSSLNEIENKFEIGDEFLKSDENLFLMKKVILKLVKDEAVLRNKSYFQKYDEIFNDAEVKKELKNLFIKYLEKSEIESALQLIGSFDVGLSRTEKTFVALFNNLLTIDLFNSAQGFENGKLTNVLINLGITKTGEQGVQELREKIKNIKEEFIENNIENKFLSFNSVNKEMFLNYWSLSKSDFGSLNQDEVEIFTRELIYLKKDGILDNENKLEARAIYDILKKNRKIENDEYNEDFLIRLKLLQSEIKTALVDDWEFLFNEFNLSLDENINNLIKSKEKQTNEFAIKNIEDNIGYLRQLKSDIKNIKEINDFSDFLKNNFIKLSNFSNFESILRKLSFNFVFNKKENTNYFDNNLISFLNIDVEKPEYKDISLIIDFISHIVISENLAKIGFDKKELKKIKKVFSIAALNDQLKKIDNRESKNLGKNNIEFLIHKNDLGVELSGYTADACWASKKLMSLDYDNLYAVSIISNKGKENERLNGSSLLLEAESLNGEKVLIIRGLNPKENLINSLDISNFFNSFVSFLKDNFGDKYKIAVAIDDHTGGFTTNRPNLFNYISGLKKELKKIFVKSDERLFFNEYNIENNIYLV